MKIDAFCHIFPQKFYDKLASLSEHGSSILKRVRGVPMLGDLDLRFRMMDRFPNYVQVPSLAAPAIEALGNPSQTPDLAKMANDGMAELVRKHPDRFASFVASVPMNNVDATVAEIDRAIVQLGATGIQIFTNVNGRPLDEPEFSPVFEKMAGMNLPVWMHPARGEGFPDYQTEKKSKFEMWWVFGWPYETSVAMSRILFAGYFDRFPNLRVITHHMGGMVPYFSGRTGPGMDQLGARTEGDELTALARRLKKRPQDYYKMFYADTALFGARHGMQCGLDYFGSDQVVFASDSPFDPEKGPGFIRETIRCLEEMPLTPEERYKIYEGNARKIMRLKLA